MAIFKRLMSTVAFLGIGLGIAHGQSPSPETEQIRARQQVATMETVLAGAIRNGTQTVIREIRRVTPEYSPRIATARVSGVRLDGYGVLFTVDVPMIPLPFLWDVRLLEVQTNALMQIQQLRAQASQMPQGPESARLISQANSLEQELTLGNFRAAQPSRGTVSAATVQPVGAVGSARPGEPGAVDNPESVYTRAVKAELIDAMLMSSQPLGVKDDEWLVVVARDGTPNNPQSPADAIDSTTQIMRVKGSTLAAFHARTILLEDARQQVEITEQ